MRDFEIVKQLPKPQSLLPLPGSFIRNGIDITNSQKDDVTRET